MTSAGDLARMVPGFEFLQGLLGNAGAGMPNIGQWVAPTLDPEELEKRINELRTVQFWLEQNARLLATTIQALEVQRMTLATLQTMNMPLKDLGDALKIKMPPPAPPPPPPRPPAPAPAPEPVAAAPAPAAPAAPAAPLVDPMQWWGALTQQFTEIASKAVKESAGEAAKNLAGVVAAKAPAKTAAAAGKAAAPARKAPAKRAGKAPPRKRIT